MTVIVKSPSMDVMSKIWKKLSTATTYHSKCFFKKVVTFLVIIYNTAFSLALTFNNSPNSLLP